MIRPKVSICVPTYFYNGHQDRLLNRLIESIKIQTYHNIELVISDQDPNEDREKDIRKLGKYLSFKDNSGISAHNTNNAITHATGDLIHILNSDDFYYHKDALSDMVTELQKTKRGWVAAACLHTDDYETNLNRLHIPSWPGEKNMVEGINRIGAPSVVLFKRELGLRCDPVVVYAMDCDLWLQAFRKSGEPAILNNPAVVIRMWSQQFTSKLNIPKQLELDKAAMRAKYGYT